MADKEIKITTLTEQQREVLKSKTPFILPDNPSQKGYSASQIKKTMYEPVLLLFDWLKRQGLETKEAFEYLNNYIFEKGNDLSEDIENSKKYAKDLVDNLALTVSNNLTESKNYTDLEIDKVELDYNNKFANVTKDVTEKHQAVTKRLDEHDIDIETLEEQVKDLFSIRQANLKIVNSIDDVKENNVIYLIKDEEAVGTDIYKEYILVDGVATLIGDTSVDLRPYLTAKQIAEQYPSKIEVDEKLDEKIGTIDSLLDELNGTSTMGLILLDGSVTKEKLSSEVQRKITNVVANTIKDYSITEGKYYNQWGILATLDIVNAYEYMLPNDLKNVVVEITTKMWSGMAIVVFNSNGNVLSYYKNTYNDEVKRTYKIEIPNDAYKIGICGSMIPIIKLFELDIDKSGGALRIFHSIGVIGDSLASGCFERTKEDGTIGYPDTIPYSWGQCIARAMGVEVTNYSSGGQTAKSMNECTYPNITPLWSSTKQLYFIALGTNDRTQINSLYANGWGTTSDVDLEDYNNNEDSFIGYYAKIIQRIREVNEDCYFFLLPNPITNSVEQLNAIKQIESLFNRCYVIDTSLYNSKWNIHNMGGHLDAYGYQIYGDYIMSVSSELILNNLDKFKQVGFIGTDYKNNNYEY